MRLLTARSFLALSLVLMLAAGVLASSGGPPADNSAGESSVAVGCNCHGVGAPTNGVAAKDVIVSISNVPYAYEAGGAYEMTISLEHASNTAGGFMLSAGGSGTFSWAEGANIRPVEGSDDPKSATSTSDDISQSKTTDPATWTFTWTAPADDAGDVTFYLAGNSVDGHGANDESDAWNLLSFVINSPASASAQADTSSRVISVGDYTSLFVSEPDPEALEHERQLTLAQSVFDNGNLLYWSTLAILIVGAVFQREILERKNGDGPDHLAAELAYPQGLKRGIIAVALLIIGLKWLADGSATYLWAPALFCSLWASYGVYRTALAAKSVREVKDMM